MGIPLSSNFDLSAQLPLDARQVAVTTVARDAIPSVERYDGLSVYVLADSKTYQLRGGIDNIDWVEDTFEDYLGVPGVDGYVLSSLIDGTRSWIAPTGMVYPPGPGIALFDGTSWLSSITDNSANWNTAYGWGDHSGLYEPGLGNPLVDGYVLSSTIAGTRSWIEMTSGSTYTFQHSLTESAGTVNLVNDSASPGNSKLYGTNGSGTRGWYDIPAAMTYPASGVSVSTGSAWDTSVALADFVRTTQANTYGDFDQIFRSSRLIIRNPANTYSYTFAAAAIVANRTLNLPLITGTDTLATLGLAQTWTGIQSYDWQKLKLKTYDGSYSYTITAAGITADRVLTLPNIAVGDTLVSLTPDQTFTGTNIFYKQASTSYDSTSDLVISSSNHNSYAGRIVYVLQACTIRFESTCPVDFHATFLRVTSGEITFGVSGSGIVIYSTGSKKRIDVQYEAAYVHVRTSGFVYLTGSLKT